MWLTSSSIGRKLVMAITGACLVLFVTFHCLMNAVAIVYPSAYNVICEFLGANWYALIVSAGLALLFILHIIYAVWLTLQNRKARGNDRYNVSKKPATVEWSSQNMLVARNRDPRVSRRSPDSILGKDAASGNPWR